MLNKPFFTVDKLGFMAGATFLAALSGYAADGSSQRSGYRDRNVAQLQVTVGFQDDYDYYPGYETYYSRNRHEFVYFDNGVWVRRSAPRGVSADVFFAAPAIRMDFHDSPEYHHAEVIRGYPRDWKRGEKRRDDRDEHRNDKAEHHDDKGDHHDDKNVHQEDQKNDRKDDHPAEQKRDDKDDHHDDSKK